LSQIGHERKFFVRSGKYRGELLNMCDLNAIGVNAIKLPELPNVPPFANNKGAE
jgi:hypothetical protein